MLNTVDYAARVCGLGVGTGEAAVLRDLDLDLRLGELVVLLGPAGCGKSTLLEVLTGTRSPDVGRVVLGREAAAVMPQEDALAPWLTARGNVDLALDLRGIPREHRTDQIDRALEITGTAAWADLRPHRLTAGQRRLTLLARALVQKRTLVLLDEPLRGLDHPTRERAVAAVRQSWVDSGSTLVVTTADPADAVDLGGRVVLLSACPARVRREWAARRGGASHGVLPPEPASATAELRRQVVAALEEE